MKETNDADFILLGGIVVAAIWSITNLYFEYTKHSYVETIWSGKVPDTGWYYVDTPVDCPPCDAPFDNHLSEEDQASLAAEAEGGKTMGP